VTPYYEQDGVALYHGDCLELLAVLSGDLMVTDPPYFLPARHYATRTDWPRSLCDVSILEGFFRQWFALATSSLSAEGVLYMFCDGQS
jgi:DNA modification methylase